MTRILVLIVVLVSMFLARPAQALCVGIGVGLAGVPGTVTFSGGGGGYDVFDVAEHMQSVSFNVTALVALASCRYYVVLSAGSGTLAQRKLPRADGAILDYNAYTTAGKSNILKDNTATASERLAGIFSSVSAGASNSHQFFWTVAPEQVRAHSNAYFQETLTLTLYAEFIFSNNYVPVDSKTISFRAQTSSSVDVALVNDGGSFALNDTVQTVDFDNLTAGESLSYDTIVRSNDGYSLSFQSAHAQKMKHETQNAAVPYSLTVNGNGVNLTGGGAVTAAVKPGATTAAGDRLPTAFTVGAMTGAEPSGDYEDVITVTVSAH